MGRKKKKISLTSLFRPWPWPPCKQPKTPSFRASGGGGEVYKTLNSVFLDSPEESWFTASTADTGESEEGEVALRGFASERFFFEPGETKSIVAAAPYEGSRVVTVESADPCGDFRASMEEMVAALGLSEWRCLEELLLWYLRVNGKKNHGFIVGAFVDLLISLVSSSYESEEKGSESPLQLL